MKLHVTASFAVALAGASLSSTAQTYRITDLGAVAGDAVSVGFGLNGSGQAAGDSSKPSAAIATLFSNGKAVSLDNNSSDVSAATAISGTGEVAGWFYNSATGSPFHAVVFQNGTLLDIHSETLFPAGTKAAAINSSGNVTGQGYLSSSSFHVFLYSGGRMVDLGPPGSYQAIPYGMNDAGQIVGSYYTSSTDNGSFLCTNGKFFNLGFPAGATGTAAFAINSVGQIAGAIYSSGAAHGGFYNNGAWTDLGAFDKVATHATGINTGGQIIGTAFFPVQSYHPFIPGKHVALLFHNGSPSDLNSHISSNSGFTLTDGVAINDSGQILCNAKNSSGAGRAVLLTPK